MGGRLRLCAPFPFYKGGALGDRAPFDNCDLLTEIAPMPVVELTDLPGALPLGAPLVGLDLGTKTIGVAVSDTSLTIASPLALIRRKKFTVDAASLLDLIDQRGAAGLVIGLPVNMDGSEGPRCQSARAFARHFMRLRDLPIAFWDERLSSAAVNRVLIQESDASRARRAELVDKMAAAWILQGALDRLNLAPSPVLK
jgi:putative Holliday junction resolvase